MKQMMHRKSCLIKIGLLAALGVLILTTIQATKKLGVTPLDNYLQWQRGQLYPFWAVRLGHILETYVEPIGWQKFKEIIFSNISLVIIIGVWGFLVTKNRVKIEHSKRKWGIWIGPLLGLIIYTWQLATVPPAVYVDEAVTGYNAFSVLMTGRDEYGKAFPILFRYFGSWLPGLNMYILVPVVKLIGLSVWAIRLPAAILGAGVCLVLYVIMKMKTKSERVSGWGTVFAAITPWMVFNARLGYEEMIGFILFAAGIGLLSTSNKRRKNIYWAITALTLAGFAAHVYRYLLAIILPVWGALYLNEVRSWPWKTKLYVVGWLVLLNIPNLLVIQTPAFWVKQVIYEGASMGRIVSNFWNQLTTYFSPVTLFVKVPDIDMQHQVPGIGLFYWWMIVPIIFGIISWSRNWKQNRFWLALIIVSIIPAAMSGAFISVQRAFPLFLPLSVAMAEGLSRMIKKPLLITLAGYSLLLLFRSYFVLLPGLNEEAWNYGYKQLAEETVKQPKAQFVIDNSRNVRNYMLPLFYLHYPPKELQETASKLELANYYYSGDPSNNHKYANMEFRPINWVTDPCQEEIMVGDELSISSDQAAEHKLTKAGEVKNRTGKTLLQWYHTNPKEKCGILPIPHPPAPTRVVD
jgi:hypothetical protein